MAIRKKKPQAAKPSKDTSTSVLVVRSRNLVKSPPGPLGFSHLLVPDEAFGKSEFKANVHFTPAAQNALFEKINEAYWDLIPDLKATAEQTKVGSKLKILSKADLIATLRDKLKEPKEGDLIQLPHMIFSTASHYTDKDGNQQAITVKAFDNHGAPLDLKEAKMGRESIVMAMFTVGVWAGSSPFSKWVALPTLRLQGLQVLKLKQYSGGQGAAVGEVTSADLAFLEADFQADDLSSLFKKPDKTPKAPKGSDVDGIGELDDEIPF